MPTPPRRRGRPPLDKVNRSVKLCVSLPPGQYDALYSRASRHRVSMPEIMRRALRHALGDDPERK